MKNKKTILLVIKIAIGFVLFAALMQFYLSYDFYMDIESEDLLIYLVMPATIYLIILGGLITSYFIIKKKN
ncbi:MULTISPECIES: hypothetical protein [unclassified Breznakia]|uniref:hypothetical protein n=1 Tax=unclassified Breznakia TaxID=2623764 RepID=UPI002475D4F5|nr:MULTISPECIES: hypothetical protein [unclassified Breznakia]MDH6367255.1 hypothetical protein [Breznakia sp. PH1-1]MDH6404434.1 hypothetical protein [Breznakia sp. PF1-11]MDH6412175.1 hypothetical protein [Breznakia sp. PFB1-11]MDH6414422.1 hypothetical protein [Breznakia sp. PFB1-14]MDH6416807.1 hypothetical protein [Breznakia sp. PFB1-4]